MSLSKEDVWADLRYALDELERPPREIHSRLTEAANLDAQPDDEFHKRLLQIGLLSGAYSKAQIRAEVKIAHEAIEKGLKAILLDGGMSEKQVRSRRHELHELLMDVEQHHPTAFHELERCFDSTIEYLKSVTSLKHDTNIVAYFLEHGKAEIFTANRYESIEGNKNKYGMIGFVYREMIRALSSLIFGWPPKDINSRIEEALRKAALTESKLGSVWDVVGWSDQEPARPQLEAIENLNSSKWLLAVVRRCARESKDSMVRYWATDLRQKSISARRAARDQRRPRPPAEIVA